MIPTESTSAAGERSSPAVLHDCRVAIVHDYLNQPGGAEKVVEVFVEMFPGAPVFTSVYDPDAMPAVWRDVDVRTSFMQRLGPRLKVAKALLPLYPLAFESFDLSEYDLVLSSTTAFAKGVLTRPGTAHVCYCNNPTRFLWTYGDYVARESLPPGSRFVLPVVASALRVWDFAAAQRVDHFVAGSHNAARRIAKYYRRDSEVLQAPIDVNAYTPAPDEVADYFLVVSRLQSYKRLDLAVEACSRLNVPLLVIGDGPDRPRLESLAGPSVRFLGRVSNEEAVHHLARCRALIFPGEEDFGLTPLEAQASGRPVIALRRGGALETVREGETGVFFDEASIESLIEALRTFHDDFNPQVLRANAARFDKQPFKQRLETILAVAVSGERETAGVVR